MNKDDYYKIDKDNRSTNLTLHWKGKRLILSYVNFIYALWATPKVEILFSTAKITFKPPQGFPLGDFLDSIQNSLLTNIFQRDALELNIELLTGNELKKL